MKNDTAAAASAAACAIVELLPDNQVARHLLTAVNRYVIATLAAKLEHDHALNATQDLILTFTGPLAPELRAHLDTLVTALEACAVCQRSTNAPRRMVWPMHGKSSVN